MDLQDEMKEATTTKQPSVHIHTTTTKLTQQTTTFETTIVETILDSQTSPHIKEEPYEAMGDGDTTTEFVMTVVDKVLDLAESPVEALEELDLYVFVIL
jgi:hypothetical protein